MCVCRFKCYSLICLVNWQILNTVLWSHSFVEINFVHFCVVHCEMWACLCGASGSCAWKCDHEVDDYLMAGIPQVLLAHVAVSGFPVCQPLLASVLKSTSWAPAIARAVLRGQARESICQVGTGWERFPRCLDGGWFALAWNIPQFIIFKCS